MSYNRLVTLDPVTVDTTVGGVDLLALATAAQLKGMESLILTPTADMRIGNAGVPLTATNGVPLYAGVTYDIPHQFGGMKAIVAAGSTTCCVTIGAN